MNIDFEAEGLFQRPKNGKNFFFIIITTYETHIQMYVFMFAFVLRAKKQLKCQLCKSDKNFCVYSFISFHLFEF